MFANRVAEEVRVRVQRVEMWLLEITAWKGPPSVWQYHKFEEASGPYKLTALSLNETVWLLPCLKPTRRVLAVFVYMKEDKEQG